METPTPQKTIELDDPAGSVLRSGYAGLVLDRLARQARQVMDVESTTIFMHEDGRRQTALAVAGCGEDADLVGTRVDVRDRIGRQATRERPNSVRASAPVRRDGRLLGALLAGTTGSESFTSAKLDLLDELAETLAPALLHAERRTDVLSTTSARVRELIGALESHDGYTVGHSEAVVDLTCTVGGWLFLGFPDLLELELASLFHDLGKVMIPESILRKPGPLDPDEQALIRHHPDWGADLLKEVPGLEPVANIVRFHHERWDGRGYPNRLEGDRIPLASRIVAVCDAYHAMTSERSYRTALPANAAVEELRATAGTQFDPQVVEALMLVLDEHGLDQPAR